MRGAQRSCLLRPRVLLRVTLSDVRPVARPHQAAFNNSKSSSAGPQRRRFTTSPIAWSASPVPAPTKDRGASKLYGSADDAVADIKSGSTILSAGFGLCGVAGKMANVTILQVNC